jgi:hypothetical protein
MFDDLLRTGSTSVIAMLRQPHPVNVVVSTLTSVFAGFNIASQVRGTSPGARRYYLGPVFWSYTLRIDRSLRLMYAQLQPDSQEKGTIACGKRNFGSR